MAIDPETLRALAQRHLDSNGRIDVETYLEEGELDIVRFYLCDAIDSRHKMERISEETAHDAYKILGLCPVKSEFAQQMKQLQLF